MTDALAVINQDHFDVLVLAGTLSEKRRHIFLRLLAETANIALAAEAAGYKNTAAVRKVARDDPAFAAALEAAAEAAGDMLEAEAVRRGKQGIKKDVWYKGEIVGEEFVYSDSLLAMLLKAAKPEKYAERSKVDSTTNIKVGIAVIPMAARSVEEWERQSIGVHENQVRLPPPEPVIEGEFVPVKISRG